MDLPKKLHKKLQDRIANKSLRNLGKQTKLVDFSSNDYLGFAKSETIFANTHQYLIDNNIKVNGATGSRLLSGNHNLYHETERFLSKLYNTEAALIFNSGYDANIGFFSTVPQRNDIILYDELSHASIRDGIQLSTAKAFKFFHNDIDDLEKKILRFTKNKEHTTYVVTESVFSMDGDSPNLQKMAEVCKKHNVFLIVDEAHAVGVFGKGLIQKLHIQPMVFAQIITFGKALGCHGAIILGGDNLKQYLINFARSFIYTTGLSPHAIATIKNSYDYLNSTVGKKAVKKLKNNIRYFKATTDKLGLKEKNGRLFIPSNSSIHSCIIGGNENTKQMALRVQQSGFDVKPILYPTVPKGKERLRFCLHSYNSYDEITDVLYHFTT